MAAVYQDSRPPIPTPPPPPPFMHNHIDLTGDDDGEIDSVAHPERDFGRSAKRPRMEGSFTPSSSQESQLAPRFGPRRQVGAFHSGPSFPGGPGSMSHLPISNHAQAFPGYRPAFAGPSSATQFGLRQGQQIQPPQHRLQQQQAPVQPPSLPQTDSKQVIDLTSSPSPPPERRRSEAPGSNPCPLPADLPPKTPVCIGQLGVTALIFDPSPYTASNDPHFDEWLPVRLQYENNPNKSPNIADTIHIKPPSHRTLDGQHDSGSFFAFVEQKVATALGPMLGKGLIRLDAKIKKGRANSPILPLQMLVYTPKGNIPVVGNFLQQCHLLLDHPSRHIFDEKILNHYHYWNPHNPPPGGHAARQAQRDMRWTATTNPGKSIEVQRSQVDELFKNLKDGDELPETEPSRDVATRLYPHQKKALTFLLEREREHCIGDVHSSLWQRRANPITRRISWFHIVTQQEVFEQPQEAKGAILADDMGLGKTITCVSLIAATLASARAFASEPIDPIPSLPSADDGIDAAHFAGSVWGMPDVHEPSTSKAKAAKLQDKLEADYVRMSRVKAKSRGTLIICPLSTVVNWEDQFREHWRGEVTVVGGNGQCLQQAGCQAAAAAAASQPPNAESQSTSAEAPPVRIRDGTPLRIYIYHGNARRPDPTFLADFDAVITTYATLASEFSKQTKSTAADEEEDESSDMGITEVDERGHPVIKIGKAKKGKKRKKTSAISNLANEVPSPLQSIHWFRVVLDEAHSIKEISTVGSRASCDLMADRRLCLTGTPVQNKLDDVFALIKFLRLAPFDEKNVWTEYVGSPVKFGQALGIARLQSIMKCITLRRTKESKTADGKRILSLPPRADELRMLKFEPHEQEIYDRFFNESKAEFNDLSNKNEIMKNYVGILQKILRLRQICDHFELVEGKELNRTSDSTPKYEDVVAAVMNEGFTKERAHCIFSILREAASTQCVECTAELSPPTEGECPEGEAATTSKRGRKPKASQKVDASSSRNATRASSPAVPRVVLTKCQHLFCIECYRNSVCPGWPAADPNAGRSCSVCQTGLKPADAIEIKCDPEVGKKKPQKREKRQKGVGLENFRPSTKVRTLVNDLAQFSRLNPHSSNYDNEIQMMDADGNPDDQIVKSVVFSQWTSMLDKIEDALEVAGIRYERLDGTMKRDERTRAMDALKFDPGCEVLLVSLKAGGVGLNLTSAQRVYLMDPYWNPAVENQAVDRIHRLGQTRPVQTVKLIIEGSIEARLLEVQRKKTALANMTLGQTISKADIMARRLDELAQLFDG